ncbi:MAG: cytochrome c1 [Rhodobacteraceae bacterium]|nr:cytochrome c1 [Paracoccaceae bacterium]
MFKKTILSALVVLGLGTSQIVAAPVGEVEDINFSFEGPFGTFDEPQLQRGLQVFTESCAACHGLNLVAYRNLGDYGGPRLSPEQVKAYAAQFEVFDIEIDDYRPAIPPDMFAGSTMENAPDLSLMAKARKAFSGPNGLVIIPLVKGFGGAEYIAAVLKGYTGEEKEEAGSILYGNTAFPGGWIAMAPPLFDEMVEFEPASDNSTAAMAKDVAAFLMWTAEPKMMERKKAGLVAVLFLTFLAVMLYLTNKKIWAKAKRKDHA